uniref:Sugar phosphate transporter domain-containing protein n=1 Tax=Lotharella oceanica TaxID=641309 RepID=A0A7S2TH58_9EUKA
MPKQNGENNSLVGQMAENSMAIFSVVFLITIAAGKTILTKAAFKQVSFAYPVILSGMSCIVTDLCILPLWGTGIASFSIPKKDKLMSFGVVTIMTALGMALQNLALNLLSVALQQALRATLPVFVVIFERIVLGKKHNGWIYVALIPLTAGPMLCVSGSRGGDITTLGLIYMSLGVLMSALKVVYLEKIVRSVRKDMGMVSFLFWLDLFMMPILAPWAVANGEVFDVTNWGQKGSAIAWGFLIMVSIMGGLRAYSINLVVKYASALTKTAADIFTQALTIYCSLVIFHTTATPLLHAGIAVTIAGFAFYTAIKYNEKQKKKASAKAQKTIEEEPFLKNNGKRVESV